MAKTKHTIRIISGTHRSRRLPVLDFPGLRPTGDQLREVLFNWLQMKVAGKNILDLCAGSGSLGFESASREAKQVTLIESNAQICQQLSKTNQDFGFENIIIHNQTAQSYLRDCNEKFDVVFLDPPFSEHSLQELTQLSEKVVKMGGFLYRESAITQEILKLANNWELYRAKTAGQVKIELWQRIN